MNNPILNSEFEAMKQVLLKTHTLAFEHEVEEFQNSTMSKEIMKELCESRAEMQKFEEAFDEIQNKSESLDDFDNLIKQLKNQKLTKKIDKQIKNELLNFDNALVEIVNKVNEKMRLETAVAAAGAAAGAATTTRVLNDDIVMTSKVNPIDPISKQRMTDPVRNMVCGHIYERKHIMAAISINKNMRCPEIGCGNRKFIVAKHLLDDMNLKMELMRMAAEEEQGDNDEA